ncbi:MAG TPA: hypothetical protein VJZ00_04445 [Thermoanaerobaculia bacterium]|nr:hypothetical protein [Thermoanaerobaculia bacterium]
MPQSRITLIVRKATKPNVDWNYARSNAMRVAFLDSVNALKFALGVAINDVALDIERVIIDRAGSADEVLDLLAALPLEFSGDVLIVRDDGNGFLSATGRGGDRVLYALSPRDVRFYLETHELVTGRAVLDVAPLKATA